MKPLAPVFTHISQGWRTMRVAHGLLSRYLSAVLAWMQFQPATPQCHSCSSRSTYEMPLFFLVSAQDHDLSSVRPSLPPAPPLSLPSFLVCSLTYVGQIGISGTGRERGSSRVQAQCSRVCARAAGERAQLVASRAASSCPSAKNLMPTRRHDTARLFTQQAHESAQKGGAGGEGMAKQLPRQAPGPGTTWRSRTQLGPS